MHLRRVIFCVALGAAFSAPLRAAEVLVVLSAHLKAYQSALDGFKKAFGAPVDVVFLDRETPKPKPGTRYIVAFGGKAALHAYPPDIPLVYALAPGVERTALQRSGQRVGIEMIPAPDAVLDVILGLQPSLKTLAVVHASPSFDNYIRAMRAAGEIKGVRVQAGILQSADDLPIHLRSIRGKVDALWIPPDPLLITPRTVSTLSDFSWANDIPLYVPIEGLPDRGAVASIACDMDHVGETAAAAVQGIKRGESPGGVVYPDAISIVINEGAAQTIGLSIPEAMRQRSKKVIP